jgi:hypothetical protein
VTRDEHDVPQGNRAKKVEGRAKRRRYVQGTRAYLHSLTNSMSRRAKKSQPDADGPEQ